MKNQPELNFDRNEMDMVLDYIKNCCSCRLTSKTRHIVSQNLDIPERKLRMIISHLNGLGEPIICDDNGIYYCQDPEVLRRVAQRYHSSAKNNTWKAEAYERIARKLEAAKIATDIQTGIKEFVNSSKF